MPRTFGQSREPRASARARRNSQAWGNEFDIVATAGGLDVDGEGKLKAVVTAPLTLAASGIGLNTGDGLTLSSGSLIANLGDGVEFASGAIQAALGSGMTIVSGAIEPNPGDGITVGATIAVDLAAGGHLSFTGGQLQVDDDFLINSGDDVMSGTLTANGFKLASVTLAGPTAGLIEYDGDRFYAYPNGEDRTINLADGIITADASISNSTTETTLYTEAIGGNELHVGQLIKCRVLGRYSTANATDTFTARLKIGGTTIGSVTSTAKNTTDGGFDVEFIITVRSIGSTGDVIHHVRATFDDDSKTHAATALTTVDTTAANDITLTVEWSAADAANTVTITQGFCEFIN